MKRALIDDIIFLQENAQPENAFIERYQHDFDPTLWGTTPLAFLYLVGERVKNNLLSII